MGNKNQINDNKRNTKVQGGTDYRNWFVRNGPESASTSEYYDEGYEEQEEH